MRFNIAYDLAYKIVKMVSSENLIEEHNVLFWVWGKQYDEYYDNLVLENLEKLYKPHKYTILHQYISDCFFADYDWNIYRIRKALPYEDENDIPQLVTDFFFSKLEVYGIKTDELRNALIKVYDDYIFNEKIEYKEYKEKVESILDSIYELILLIESSLVEEVFHLLYSNKDFLYLFSELLSDSISSIDHVKFPKFLTSQGYIRRIVFPQWVRNAVFYRDNATCQHCGKDLSSSFRRVSSKEIHYDHIIPLKLGGSNDPTNVQLLCDNCNLSKNASKKIPNYLYQKFW